MSQKKEAEDAISIARIEAQLIGKHDLKRKQFIREGWLDIGEAGSKKKKKFYFFLFSGRGTSELIMCKQKSKKDKIQYEVMGTFTFEGIQLGLDTDAHIFSIITPQKLYFVYADQPERDKWFKEMTAAMEYHLFVKKNREIPSIEKEDKLMSRNYQKPIRGGRQTRSCAVATSDEAFQQIVGIPLAQSANKQFHATPRPEPIQWRFSERVLPKVGHFQ